MILTEEKAAFAAEHHGVITQYLKERGLSPDEYYDTVVFAFWIVLYPAKTILKSAHMRRWTERLRQ